MSDKNKTTTFQHTWLDEDGVQHPGTFTAKRLSVMERSKVAVRRSQLSGGMYCVRDDDGAPTGQGIDPSTDYINIVIAHLEIALIQKPIWFKLEEMTDMGLATDVYDKILEFEMTFFRQRDRGAADGSQSSLGGEEDSSEKPAISGSPTTATAVVGQQVQAALDA